MTFEDLEITGLPNTEPDLSDFAQGMLEKIEEADRPTVQKYMKEWDSGVTTKFKEYTDKLKPYEELGPLEDIQQALQWIGTMNEDPLEFYNKYTQALKEANMLPGEEQRTSNLPEFDGLPEQFVEQYTNMQKELGSIKQQQQEFMSSREEEKIIKQVDDMMKSLHDKHGDFDEDWVLLQMQRNNTSPEDAVALFNKNIVEKFGSQRKPPPNIMSGTGSVPNGQVDLSKMTNQEKRDYMVKRLKEANAAN